LPQIPGAIFDFALYFFHNARQLLDNGNGPYFYLPKMQVGCIMLPLEQLHCALNKMSFWADWCFPPSW
jgi:hypothetical protein